VRVFVEDLGTREYQRVTGEVEDQINEQAESGEADEELGADGG
jgi:hypothetical protein